MKREVVVCFKSASCCCPSAEFYVIEVKESALLG